MNLTKNSFLYTPVLWFEENYIQRLKSLAPSVTEEPATIVKSAVGANATNSEAEWNAWGGRPMKRYDLSGELGHLEEGSDEHTVRAEDPLIMTEMIYQLDYMLNAGGALLKDGTEESSSRASDHRWYGFTIHRDIVKAYFTSHSLDYDWLCSIDCHCSCLDYSLQMNNVALGDAIEMLGYRPSIEDWSSPKREIPDAAEPNRGAVLAPIMKVEQEMNLVNPEIFPEGMSSSSDLFAVSPSFFLPLGCNVTYDVSAKSAGVLVFKTNTSYSYDEEGRQTETIVETDTYDGQELTSSTRFKLWGALYDCHTPAVDCAGGLLFSRCPLTSEYFTSMFTGRVEERTVEGETVKVKLTPDPKLSRDILTVYDLLIEDLTMIGGCHADFGIPRYAVGSYPYWLPPVTTTREPDGAAGSSYHNYTIGSECNLILKGGSAGSTGTLPSSYETNQASKYKSISQYRVVAQTGEWRDASTEETSEPMDAGISTPSKIYIFMEIARPDGAYDRYQAPGTVFTADDTFVEFTGARAVFASYSIVQSFPDDRVYEKYQNPDTEMWYSRIASIETIVKREVGYRPVVEDCIFEGFADNTNVPSGSLSAHPFWTAVATTDGITGSRFNSKCYAVFSFTPRTSLPAISGMTLDDYYEEPVGSPGLWTTRHVTEQRGICYFTPMAFDVYFTVNPPPSSV